MVGDWQREPDLVASILQCRRNGKQRDQVSKAALTGQKNARHQSPVSESMGSGENNATR